MLKTKVIDFSQPFLWFEDMPTEGERAVLAEHGATDSPAWVDRVSGAGLCDWLAENQ